MEEYRWKRFQWRMERRHARRSLLKFLFLFLALCVVLDVWGPGQIALMALLGLFVLWLLAQYLRVRNEGLDGRRFAKVRKQLCSPRELEEQLREACPHLKWEGSP